MKSIFTYLSERFPVHLALLLALIYSLLLLGTATATTDLIVTWQLVLLVTFSFFAFLLRLRVTDEFKDSKHDAKHYPTRPLQRGVVTKRQLSILGGVAFIVELALLLLINPLALLAYLPVVAFSILLAKEFFAPKWLEKHFTLYFLSHQTIFVLFAVWAFVTFAVPVTAASISGGAAFIISMCLLEILRKLEIRRNPKGKIVKDTYPTVWGIPLTFALISSSLIIVGLLLTVTSGNAWLLGLSIIGTGFVRTDNFKLTQAGVALTLLAEAVIFAL